VSANVAGTNQEEDNIAYAKQMLKNEEEFMKKQKQYLGGEYQRQQREKEMMQRLERDRKVQEQFKMKAEENQLKSVSSLYFTSSTSFSRSKI
jgi:hypothetical protein